MLLNNILLFLPFPLNILEEIAFGIHDYLGTIVEKDSSASIAENVAQPVLAAVIDPFFDIDFVPVLTLTTLGS